MVKDDNDEKILLHQDKGFGILSTTQMSTDKAN